MRPPGRPARPTARAGAAAVRRARAQGREPAQPEDGGPGRHVRRGGEHGLAGEDGERAQADLDERPAPGPSCGGSREAPVAVTRGAQGQAQDEGQRRRGRRRDERGGRPRAPARGLGGRDPAVRTCGGKSGMARPAPMWRMTAPSTSWHEHGARSRPRPRPAPRHVVATRRRRRPTPARSGRRARSSCRRRPGPGRRG